MQQSGEAAVVASIFRGMFVPVALPMPPGVEDNKDKYEKTEHQQYYYAGLVFPDLLDAIRQLGPIHAGAKYTATNQK